MILLLLSLSVAALTFPHTTSGVPPIMYLVGVVRWVLRRPRCLEANADILAELDELYPAALALPPRTRELVEARAKARLAPGQDGWEQELAVQAWADARAAIAPRKRAVGLDLAVGQRQVVVCGAETATVEWKPCIMPTRPRREQAP